MQVTPISKPYISVTPYPEIQDEITVTLSVQVNFHPPPKKKKKNKQINNYFFSAKSLNFFFPLIMKISQKLR